MERRRAHRASLRSETRHVPGGRLCRPHLVQRIGHIANGEIPRMPRRRPDGIAEHRLGVDIARPSRRSAEAGGTTRAPAPSPRRSGARTAARRALRRRLRRCRPESAQWGCRAAACGLRTSPPARKRALRNASSTCVFVRDPMNALRSGRNIRGMGNWRLEPRAQRPNVAQLLHSMILDTMPA